MVAATLPLAGFATSTIADAIRAIYQIAGDINSWMNDHIQGMQKSDNQTVARTGRVLEGAKFGFGIGYITPVTVIVVGQFLLGNPLDAVMTLGSAAVLTNPFAMTCAAVGAIYFGWNALSDQERNEALEKLAAALQIGMELIKAIVSYVLTAFKELISSKNLAELKTFVREVAATFGRKLGDITHAVVDRLSDTARSTRDVAASAIGATADGVTRASKTAATKTTAAAGSMKKVLDQNGDGRLGVDDLVHAGKRVGEGLKKVGPRKSTKAAE